MEMCKKPSDGLVVAHSASNVRLMFFAEFKRFTLTGSVHTMCIPCKRCAHFILTLIYKNIKYCGTKYMRNECFFFFKHYHLDQG